MTPLQWVGLGMLLGCVLAAVATLIVAELSGDLWSITDWWED